MIYKTTTRFFLSCIYKEAKALFPFAYLQREIRIIRSNVSDDHRIPAVTGESIFVIWAVIFNKADLSAVCCLDHEGTHGIAGGDAFIGRDGPFLLLREGTNVGVFFGITRRVLHTGDGDLGVLFNLRFYIMNIKKSNLILFSVVSQ